VRRHAMSQQPNRQSRRSICHAPVRVRLIVSSRRRWTQPRRRIYRRAVSACRGRHEPIRPVAGVATPTIEAAGRSAPSAVRKRTIGRRG
jgi:hypothetical protein